MKASYFVRFVAVLGLVLADCGTQAANRASGEEVEEGQLPALRQDDVALALARQAVVDKLVLLLPREMPRLCPHVSPDQKKDTYYTDLTPEQLQAFDFDIGSVFTGLRHLSVEQGYVLGYVYGLAGLGAARFIYARKDGDPPHTSISEYVSKMSTPEKARHAYLSHIRTDGSPDGFFELVVLAIMGDEFYFGWHDAYHDDRVVCHPSGLPSELESPPPPPESAELDDKLAWRVAKGALRLEYRVPVEVLVQARKLDLAPKVEVGPKIVVVKVVVFTKWGGFKQVTYEVSREFPHEVRQVYEQVLIPYDCGVMF